MQLEECDNQPDLIPHQNKCIHDANPDLNQPFLEIAYCGDRQDKCNKCKNQKLRPFRKFDGVSLNRSRPVGRFNQGVTHIGHKHR